MTSVQCLTKAVLVIIALFVLSNVCLEAVDVHAATANAEQPALTPEQTKFRDASVECGNRALQKKIPRSQGQGFLRKCYKELGITKHVELPPNAYANSPIINIDPSKPNQ